MLEGAIIFIESLQAISSSRSMRYFYSREGNK